MLLVSEVPSDTTGVEQARTDVLACLEKRYADAELADDLAMVAAELLENAVKYGKQGEPTIHLEVREEGDLIAVAVTNLFESAPGVVALKKRIDWLHGFDDPAAAFAAAMEEVSERDDQAQSKLGLVRIAHQGACRLDADVVGDTLIVTGRRAVPGR